MGLSASDERLKFPSGPELTPAKMAATMQRATEAWKYDVISMGYPGSVMQGKPAEEPRNLASGWVGFDYDQAFGKPVRIVNDAAMQALGGYRGGRMLFLGLGTGLGSALVVEGLLQPLELAHLPYRNDRTFEDYVGLRGFKRMGKKRWRRHVEVVIAQLKHALQADYVTLGGGQTKHLDALPPGVRLGSNADAIIGGFRLWSQPEWVRDTHFREETA